jgi:cytochrome b561
MCGCAAPAAWDDGPLEVPVTTTRLSSTRPAPDVRTSYGRLRVALHWIGAAAILALMPTGYLMARAVDDAQRLMLYGVHMLVGWAVVAVMVARLVLRFRRPVAPPSGLPAWNRRLHTSVHLLATIVPLLLALSGIGIIVQNDLTPALQAGVAPPAELEVTQARDAHAIGAYVYLVILAIHVAGVVRYQATKGDVLSRMGIRNVRAGG